VKSSSYHLQQHTSFSWFEERYWARRSSFPLLL